MNTNKPKLEEFMVFVDKDGENGSNYKKLF